MVQVAVKSEKTEEKSPESNMKAPEKNFKQRMWLWWPILGLTLLTLGLRLWTMPNFVESRDGLFFTRGVERYATVEMRPHWPGYPVYIWLAKILNLFFHNPTLSLHVLSVIASSLTIIPIFALTKEWRLAQTGDEKQATRSGWLAAGLWAVLPLSWITGTEIFSDALALLLGLVLVWLCWHALKADKDLEYFLLPAAVCGGLMVGVRLSYITLLAPLFYVSFMRRGYRLGKVPLFIYTTLALGFTGALWLGWQLLMEGSRFFQATNQHLIGHYSSWGGSITTDQHPLTRPLRLLETNVIYGFGGWWPSDVPLWRLPATLAVLAVLAVGCVRLARNSAKQPLILIGLVGVPYLLWILLGNDVDLARYSLPFVALIAIIAGLGLPMLQKWAFPTIAVTVIAVAIVGVPLGFEHRDSLPIMHRLTGYLNGNLDPEKATVIVTDDVANLIFFTQENSPFIQSVRVRTEDMENQVRDFTAQGRTVYAVGLPNVKLAGWLPEARLCRSRFLESRGPLEVWVYRYAPGQSAAVPNECY